MYILFTKRLFDLVFAILVLPFWILILIVIGPIIYFQDNGPIFYNAFRLGKNGKIFKMFKFRSMKMNAPDIRNEDGSTYNSEDDPRLTPIGKFIRKTSLDETPQILNILRNDMSIIGPRPDLPEHRMLYQGNESRKLEIKPGITGYNQAFFRNTITWKDRIQHDIYYVDHLSFSFDMKILFKTIISVIMHKNIYISENNKSIVNKGGHNEGRC